jgi:hypothetical protein
VVGPFPAAPRISAVQAFDTKVIGLGATKNEKVSGRVDLEANQSAWLVLLRIGAVAIA